MEFLLFSIRGCYPCELATKVLREDFSEMPITKLNTRDSNLVEVYGVRTSPTLIILDAEENVVGKLVGAHRITKNEIQGIIAEFFNC